MALEIDKKHFDLIKTYGEASYPLECCGFLLGRQNGGDKEVVTTLPADNASAEQQKHHRFLITPQTFLRGEKFAREQGLEIVGFYHSHPNAEAMPSPYDLQHGWPWYSYIIVSVKEQKADAMTSWVLQDDREKFNKEKLIVLNKKALKEKSCLSKF